MDKKIPYHAPMQRPGCEVVTLRPYTRGKRDLSVLAQAFADKSLREADDMLCNILEGIAEWLDMLQQAMAAQRCADMVKPARRIALVAGQIGLIDVAIAAEHIVLCAAHGDGHAIAATIGRLERAFDVAVTEVWDFRDC